LTDEFLANGWIRQKFYQTDSWFRASTTDSEVAREEMMLVRFLEGVEGVSSIFEILHAVQDSSLLFDAFALFGFELINNE
jgi:hypothetical protein